MYTDKNFKSKKQLRETVAKGEKIRLWQPGPFSREITGDGTYCVEGPHFPQPHTWYAECTVRNGLVVKVK